MSAAKFCEYNLLSDRFNTFGQCVETELLRHGYDCRYHPALVWILITMNNEGPVNFEPVNGETSQ